MRPRTLRSEISEIPKRWWHREKKKYATRKNYREREIETERERAKQNANPSNIKLRSNNRARRRIEWSLYSIATIVSRMTEKRSERN